MQSGAWENLGAINRFWGIHHASRGNLGLITRLVRGTRIRSHCCRLPSGGDGRCKAGPALLGPDLPAVLFRRSSASLLQTEQTSTHGVERLRRWVNQVGPKKPPAPKKTPSSCSAKAHNSCAEVSAKNGAALRTAAHTAWRRGHQVQAAPRSGKRNSTQANGRSSLEYS